MADTGQGFKYQLSVAAYMASLLSKNEKVKDYHIFYELDVFAPFDDIVLAVNYNNSEDLHLYLIQVKSGKVVLEINKYLKGYKIIMNNKQWNIFGNTDSINKEKIEFWYFACKNFRNQPISFQADSEVKELQMKERICNRNESIIMKNVYGLSFKNEELHLDFFNDFYIFLSQPDTNKIGNALKGMWGLNDAGQIIEYLDKYFTKNRKNGLHKRDFEHELLRNRLSDVIVAPTKIVQFKKELASAWNNLTLSHNVTIVKNKPEIETCLFGCISVKIDDIIDIEQWNSFVDNAGKLIKDVKDKFSTKSFKPETLKDVLIHLWTCGKIPLILKSSNPLPLLKEFSHLAQHYVIVDSNPDQRYDEMKSYDLSVIKNLEEADEDQLFKSILVSMQGRKPVSLHTVTEGNKTLMGTLTCSDIIKLIEPRQVYVSKDCLGANKYMLFIIEIEGPDLIYEDHKPHGDNICVYCHFDRSSEVYEKFRQDPRFKNYIIYCLRYQDKKLTLANKELYGKNTEEHLVLASFLIDQYGENIYINGEDAVPILGEVMKLSCLKYLQRRLCKGVVVKNQYETLPDDKTTNSAINFTETVFSDKDFFKEMSGKMCVVTGEVGMGKTTLLQSLVRTCEPKYYVLFCNLARFQVDMRENNNKLFNDPLNFFWSKQVPLPFSEFLTALQNDWKRLVIVLDSFDEVISTCKREILKVITKLTEETCLAKIIIGSRLLTVNLLTDQFEIDVAKIEGFNNEYSDVKYLENWGFDSDSLQKIPAEFATNPLYLDMLRTISLNSDIDFENLNRWTLYEHIVDSEVSRYCRRNLHIFDDIDRRNIMTFHWELAMKLIFGVNNVTEKFVRKKLEKFPNSARLGMIKAYDENEDPVFVHHTFAEFFVAQWLIETTDKEDAQYIYNIILESRQFDVLRIHSEQFSLHKLILDATLSDGILLKSSVLEQIENLCNGNKDVLVQRDGMGRTALHLAAMCYHCYNNKCLEMIIHCMRKEGYDLYSRDEILNWTWIDYCEMNSWFNITDIFPPLFATQEAYWSYFASQAGNLNTAHIWKNMPFDIQYKMALAYSNFNIIDDLLIVRYFHNNDFVRFRYLCLHSEIPIAALPQYFQLDEIQITPLHVAVMHSNISLVKIRIQCGDNINAADLYGCTPLYYSVCKQKKEIVKLLLENDANIVLPQYEYLSIFQMSLQMGNKNITKMLTENVDLEKFGSILLSDAVNFGDIEVVGMLLNAKIDPNKKGIVCGGSRFENILTCRDLLTVFRQHIYNCNCDIGAMTVDELQPLINALKKFGKIHFSIQNSYFVRPLHLAVHAGRKDIIELLLQYGADVNLEAQCENSDYHTTPICCAIRYGSVDMVEFLLKKGVNVNYKDRHGLTPLNAAIEGDGGNLVQSLLSEIQTYHNAQIVVESTATKLSVVHGGEISSYVVSALNAIEKVGWILNKLAVSQRKLQLIEVLLKYNADVNARDNHKSTPLDRAIADCNWEIVEVLLQNGAKPHCLKTFDFTQLLALLPAKNIKIVELLLKNGADPNFRTACDVTPLYVAARKGNPNLVNLLFNYGAKDTIITSTNTMLAKAKKQGKFDVVIWLCDLDEICPIDHSVYPQQVADLIENVKNAANIDLVAEISKAHRTKKIKFLRTLLDHGADLRNPNGIKYINAILDLNNRVLDKIFLGFFRNRYLVEINFYTAVGFAAKQRNKSLISVLTRNGEGINATNTGGRTALISVIKANADKSVIQFLIENQADINLPDEGGNTPLIAAIRMKNLDVVELLLENNVNINYVSKNEFTPLIAAVEEVDPIIVCALLDKGADMNFVCEGGLTPLYVAVLKGNAEIIKMLLSSGASSNIETCGNTFLYYAIKSGNNEMVSLLLSKSHLPDRLNIPGNYSLVERILGNLAEVNAVNEFGSTPLHLATEIGNYKIVWTLLDSKAHPNQVDKHGRTPLHYAVATNRTDIVKCLLRNEAEVNIQDEYALTPFDYAVINKKAAIINMMQVEDHPILAVPEERIFLWRKFLRLVAIMLILIAVVDYRRIRLSAW